MFLAAKFIVGASIGSTTVTVSRYIEEYVPLKWFGMSQAIAFCSMEFGIFLSTMLGVLLPPDEDEAALETNTSWRIMFAVQPVL